MADIQAYSAGVVDTARRASEMRNALVSPLRRGVGFFVPTNGQEAGERDTLLAQAIRGTIYESIGTNGAMVAAVHSLSLQNYEKVHGALPSDDMLASMYRTVQNTVSITKGTSGAPGVYEGAEMSKMMSTSEGVMMRDRMISLILPVHLQTITSNFVTFIPGEFNQSEFFRVKRVAASSFGTLKAGDDIGFDYKGLYAVMDQLVELGIGDGSKTTFDFSSAVKFGTKYPFVPRRMKVIYDHEIVGADTGAGALAGSFRMGSETVVVSGTVDYTNGTCNIETVA